MTDGLVFLRSSAENGPWERRGTLRYVLHTQRTIKRPSDGGFRSGTPGSTVALSDQDNSVVPMGSRIEDGTLMNSFGGIPVK